MGLTTGPKRGSDPVKDLLKPTTGKLFYAGLAIAAFMFLPKFIKR